MTVLYEGNHASQTYGFPDGVAAKDPSRYGQVTDPLGQYDKVWHVQVRPGDNNVTGSGPTGERCEGLASVGAVSEPLYGREGRTHYWAVDVVFGNGYTPNSSGWNSFWQWHNTGTTGATCDFMTPNSQIVVQAAGDPNAPHGFQLVPKLETGRRYELAVKWVWSSDPSKGGLQVWLDGSEVLPFTHVATLYQGQATYPKLGNYRVQQGFVADLYYHGYRCADSLKDAVGAFTKSAHAAGWAALTGGTPPPPPPPPADTTQVLIDKGLNELYHTTITYPDWKQRVDSGFYAARHIDPMTGTGWGRGLAYLERAKG